MNAEQAARTAFGDDVVVFTTTRTGEYDVHVTFDPTIHLDDGDTYLGTVYRDAGAWHAVARAIPFTPSDTNEPPVEYDGFVTDPYPIERKP